MEKYIILLVCVLIVGMAGGVLAVEYPFQEMEGYIIALTDVHAGIGDQAAKAVAKEIIGFEVPPEYIFIGGDLTEMGSKFEFGKLKEDLAPLIEQIPIGWMMGNHDARWSEHGFYLFEKELGPPYFAIDFERFVFIGLNSATLLEQHGHFGSAQIDWLKGVLEGIGPEKPIIIQAHHPFGGPSQFTDDGYKVLALIKDYNVPLIMVGHGHSYDVYGSFNHSWIQMVDASIQQHYTPVSWDAENLYLWGCKVGKEPDLLKTIPLKIEKREDLKLIATPSYREQTIHLFLETAQLDRIRLVLNGQTKEFNLSRDGMLNLRWELENPIIGQEMLLIKGYGQDTTMLATCQVEGEMEDIKWSFASGDSIFTQPIVDDQHIYFGNQAGTFYALDKATGKVSWSYQTEAAIISSPALYEHLVIFASTDTHVYALNRKSGDLIWKKEFPGVIYSGITVGKDKIAFGVGDYQIYGLKAKTGEQVWKSFGWGMIQSPAGYHDGHFIFTSWGGVVQFIDVTTGRPVKAYPSGSGYTTPGPCTPVVINDRVLYTNTGNKYNGQSLQKKDDIWEVKDFSVGYASPVVDGTYAYLSTLKGEIFKFDPVTGEHVWMTDLPQAVYDSSPQLFRGYLVVGTTAGDLWILRRQDGAVVKQISLGNGFIFGKIRATNDTLYVGSMDGTMYAIDVSEM